MSKETFKDVEVGDRKFRLHKFDALTGSYIMYTLLTQILPMGLGKQIEGLEAEAGANANLPVMSKEKFMEMQKDCLRACSEIKGVDNQVLPVSVMLPDGRWGIDDIKDDAPLAMVLTIQVLGYNSLSFFAGNALGMFQTSIAQLNLPNA